MELQVPPDPPDLKDRKGLLGLPVNRGLLESLALLVPPGLRVHKARPELPAPLGQLELKELRAPQVPPDLRE